MNSVLDKTVRNLHFNHPILQKYGVCHIVTDARKIPNIFYVCRKIIYLPVSKYSHAHKIALRITGKKLTTCYECLRIHPFRQVSLPVINQKQ